VVIEPVGTHRSARMKNGGAMDSLVIP